MKKAHIADGVALTKFLYWIKNINKKKISEIDAQNKLKKFRKMNKNFLYLALILLLDQEKWSHNSLSCNKKNCRTIEKKDIFLCDSGGQYKYGTTDVTRTICFSKPSNHIKNIFTYVLKGHIAVATQILEKDNIGKNIDHEQESILN